MQLANACFCLWFHLKHSFSYKKYICYLYLKIVLKVIHDIVRDERSKIILSSYGFPPLLWPAPRSDDDHLFYGSHDVECYDV